MVDKVSAIVDISFSLPFADEPGLQNCEWLLVVKVENIMYFLSRYNSGCEYQYFVINHDQDMVIYHRQKLSIVDSIQLILVN